MNPVDFATPDELADILKISRAWVMKAVKRGDFPHTKFGRYVRFTAEHIEQIVAAHQQDAKPSTPADDWGRVARRKTS